MNIVHHHPDQANSPIVKRWRILSAGLAIIFGYYLFIGFSGGEAFPFSTFPMYSVARLDPYVVPTQKVFAYAEDGTEHVVTDQGIRGRVRALRSKIVLDLVDTQTIAAFADELVRRINAGGLAPEPVARGRVMEHRVELPPMGERGARELEIVSSYVLFDASPENALYSSDATPDEN